ncbi:MAG: argininosuccinate lyase [Lachnospiraceae bacterium]|nr:argininosuccinate lyase [Lachnospiraceae bacterium]
MAQLWGGRFVNATDTGAFDFNASISFDKRLYREDITGSIAHAKMLGSTGIITEDEMDDMISSLQGILHDVEDGKLQITNEYEDIHSFVESVLTERIGDTGKKLHTGRSRNDQVALDMKLYTRNFIDSLDETLTVFLNTLLEIIKTNTDTYMPGFTHLQKAQPVTLSHYISAYFEMFLRDRDRLKDTRKRLNLCPLGCGALAGTTYPLDRDLTASLLGFDGPTRNSMDSVSDRDYLIEVLNDLAILMMHLSRFSEEIIIWNSDEYRFVEIDDSFSTGSSIMPQKKNPDIAELVRGKTGRVYGSLMSLLTTMKGLPLAYDKDMQEDKEVAFDAFDTAHFCVKLFDGMMKTISFNKEKLDKSARHGFTNATDVADYLVRKNIPFRDAHAVSGRLVLKCIDKGCALDDLSLEEFKSECEAFEDDIYEAISLKTCVEKRLTTGAPSKEAVMKNVRLYEELLNKR